MNINFSKAASHYIESNNITIKNNLKNLFIESNKNSQESLENNLFNLLQESREEDIGDISDFETPSNDYWTNKVLEVLKEVNYRINPRTGLYDVNGDVSLDSCDLESFGDIKFGTIYEGFFDCSYNKLASLEGCPQIVERSFRCDHNKLTSLKYSPQKTGSFYCNNNLLLTLEGAPDFINGEFYCNNNQLTTLGDIKLRVKGRIFTYNNPLNGLQESREEDLGDVSEFEQPDYWSGIILQLLNKREIEYTIDPKTGLYNTKDSVNLRDCNLESFGNIKFGTINGSFDCSNNKLTSLKGAPTNIQNSFSCSINQLTTLEGAPEYVGGSFYCSRNQFTTLEGAPEKIEGDFYCNNSTLRSLKGAPKHIGGDLYCKNNCLLNLEGAPEHIGGDFHCENNYLTTLKGSPDYIGGDLICGKNFLTTLGDIKSKVRGRIFTYNNPLNTLQESVEENIGDVSEFEKPDYWTGKVLQILKEREIEYTINPETGLYDGYYINLERCNLESFGNIKFGTVKSFDCSNNKLTSLKGSPRRVEETFYCDHNQLTTLEGAPEYVGRNFYCMDNQLTTLGDIRSRVRGIVAYQGNPLLLKEDNKLQKILENNDIGDIEEFEKPTYWTNKVLEILKSKYIEYTVNPKTGLYDINGSIDLSDCGLESFGDVRFGTVNGSFDCSYNRLTTLEGCPQKIYGSFWCNYNKIINLKGVPNYIKKAFVCKGNQIISLDIFPRYIGGNVYISTIIDNIDEGTLKKLQKKVGGRLRVFNSLYNHQRDSEELH